jgi:hypothetical protein
LVTLGSVHYSDGSVTQHGVMRKHHVGEIAQVENFPSVSQAGDAEPSTVAWSLQERMNRQETVDSKPASDSSVLQVI